MSGIEESLIGSILIDTDCFKDFYDSLKPEMFQSVFCKNVYAQALSMYEKGEKIDPILLSEKCADTQVDAETYRRQMADCIIDVPTSVHAKEYAEKIIENYRSIRLANILTEVKTEPNQVNDQIGTLITRLEELQSSKKQQSRTLSELVEKYQYDYFTDNKVINVVRLGMNKLDDVVTLEGGDICVIGARPATGKSALATQIIANVARQGKKVGYFNLEMSENQVYERFLAKQSELDLVRIRKANNFLGNEQEQFVKANRELKKLNVVISAGSKTDLDIKAECRYQNFDLIVVDYLQLIRCHKKCESRRVEVGEISRAMKALAMELNIPIILLSQLNRATEHTQDKEPTMADLRETGDIEQDASVIILLWNLSSNSELKSYKGLKVEKNRQGELMDENLIFSGKYMSFGENTKNTLAEVKTWVKEQEKNSSSMDVCPFD